MKCYELFSDHTLCRFVILKGGTDRVSYTTNDLTTDHGATVRRSRSYVWSTLNVDAMTLVSTTESTLDGLQSWQTQYRDASTPVTSHSQTAYGANGVRTVTSTAPDNSYTISVYTNGQSLSVTRYDSGSAQIGKATYGYDAHGRQNQVTDARNGTATLAYNNADQVQTSTTPVPATGQSAQTTITWYNNMLQATNVMNPDGTSVTTEYYLTGELKRQYGSRTYPVGYGYDYAGRMKTMTNWSTFPTTGARVTTWNYNPYHGWLDNKQYPDGQGPSYAYTPAGRLQTRTWARTVGGQALTTTYAFDNSGAVNAISYSDSTPGITYTYDRLGRPATVLQNGMTATFAYNLAGEPQSESYSGGVLNSVSLASTYDTLLRRTDLSAQYSSTPLLHHSFGYDNASRLQTVTDNTGSPAYSATYSYLANSPLVSQIAFKQATTPRMTTTKQYDYLNRLLSVSSAPSAASALSFGYAYNNANQRIRSTLADGSYWLYTYDNLGQVISGNKYWSDGSPVAGQQFGYGFDDIGNRQTTASGGDNAGQNLRPASYSANTLNQYTQRTVPGYVQSVGSANANATVTLWSSDGSSASSQRKGDYFRAELPVDNTSTGRWLTLTNLAVLNNGTNADIVATTVGHEYLPQTPEQFTYDADGNLTQDGYWN